MVEYNKNEVNFNYKWSDRLKTAGQCRLSMDPTVDQLTTTHSVWNSEEYIEPQLSATTEAAKGVLGTQISSSNSQESWSPRPSLWSGSVFE